MTCMDHYEIKLPMYEKCIEKKIDVYVLENELLSYIELI